ncbi:MULTISPECIES: hypothetical protein [unclassified Acinetobacter]|uniref:hypothetical protein n=1 Tax=unclassified Acinetobacter TaxID=196816 RepID=UPI0025781663|nr:MULTISPECIES: hypothetical protein [unclassified Acinetobacter]MDM1762730.1 hypothetical protein [Acinetobacter sp. 226-1]MDM1766209.1 hypothetical protein [Acinetobacter sp. 226-4]
MIQPAIAQIILILLLVLSWGGIIFWLVYITIKGLSPYEVTKENRRFILFIFLMMSAILMIYDFTPADATDLEKINRYLEQAKQEHNQDLVLTIQQIKMQPQISIKDRKYIEKLIEKGI